MEDVYAVNDFRISFKVNFTTRPVESEPRVFFGLFKTKRNFIAKQNGLSRVMVICEPAI